MSSSSWASGARICLGAGQVWKSLVHEKAMVAALAFLLQIGAANPLQCFGRIARNLLVADVLFRGFVPPCRDTAIDRTIPELRQLLPTKPSEEIHPNMRPQISARGPA